MTELELLVDLHLDGHRQGPGSSATTLKALKLTGLTEKARLRIADLGCGTGASTLILAEMLNGEITAVDLFPEFLDRLTIDAAQYRLVDKIQTQAISMDALSFGPESLDLIWSEGAIYNIGFKKGAYYWGQFLKPGGVLAVSEITWLTDQRPAEVEAYWHSFYPEIATLDKKTAILEELGFEIIDTIIFPESCWEEEYYQSLEGRYDNFLARHQDNELAARVVAADREEIKMYRKYKSYYSYAFYIARKK